MSNKVLITNSQKAVKVPSGLRILIRRACNAVLEYEHFDEPAEISVTFVDNAAIAELNNQYRNKPMPTDVLSPSIAQLAVESFDIPGEPMPTDEFFEKLTRGDIGDVPRPQERDAAGL